MKGLLLKDLGLLKGQKRFFLTVIGLAIVMGVTMKDSSFVIGYITFIIPMFSLSTIGYDEFDNGNAFLFTLPITRRLYVWEKYLFTLLLGGGAMVVAAVLGLVLNAAVGSVPVAELLMTAPVVFAVMLLIQSVMLPLQFKYGTEKGRIAMLLAGGGTAVVGIGGWNLLEARGVDTAAILQKLEAVSLPVFLMALVIVTAAGLFLSVAVSTAIIRKKEF